MDSRLIFYAGIAIICAAAISAVTALIYFKRSGKRLKETLDREYGKKRHD